jgi:guanylate kinase
VLSGPSGAGKGTIGKALVAREPHLWFSVSWNTRPPRPGERDGVEYHFVSREAFLAKQREGGFLESFDVYGDLKGTPRGPVEDQLAAGGDVLLELDVQGARAVKRVFPEAVLVFVKPPSRDEQRRRVEERPVEVPEDLDRRLGAAEAEEAAADDFDHVVVNASVDDAVAQVAGILAGHRARHDPEPA